MFQHDIQIRVRYAETDQMGFVYYGNYATYFEVARVESFRQLGFSYKSMEEKGVMMPVLELKTKFIRPAIYDDLLTIRTYIKEMPHTRIKFEYEVLNESGVLLNLGETSLVFVNSISRRPCAMPESFLKLLKPYFSSENA